MKIRTIGTPRVRHGQKKIHAIAFSPDGSLVAAGGYGDEVRVWRVTSGEIVARHAATGVKAIAFMPDGRVAWATHGAFRIEDDGGKNAIPKSGIPREVHSLAFDATGTRVAIGGWYADVNVFDLASGELLFSHAEGGQMLAWSKSGQLATTSIKSVLTVIDLSVQPPTSWRFGSLFTGVYALGWSASGDDVLGIAKMSGGAVAHYFDPKTKTEVRPPKTLPCEFMNGAWSPDLKRLAWANDAWVDIVDVETGELIPPRDELELGDSMRVAVSPDGKSVVVSGDDNELTLFDEGDAVAWSVQTDGVGSVAFSANQKRVAFVRGGRVEIRDAMNGNAMFNVTFVHREAAIGEVVFAPDGSFLVFALDASTGGPMGEDGRYIAWLDLQTMTMGRSWIHRSETITDSIGQSSDTEVSWERESIIEGLAASSDSKLIASTSLDCTRVWRRDESGAWKMIADIPSGGRAVAFRENDAGSSLVIAREKCVEIWAIDGATALETFATAATDRARCSRDGSVVALANKTKMQIVRTRDGATSTFEDHIGRLTSVALSDDGKHFASAGEDRTIRRRVL